MLLSSGEITEPCGTPCFPDARSILRSSHSTSGSFTRRDFLQYDVMSYRVEIGSQIEIDHVGLAVQYCCRDALDRRVCSLLRPNEPGWKSASKIGSRISFSVTSGCAMATI